MAFTRSLVAGLALVAAADALGLHRDPDSRLAQAAGELDTVEEGAWPHRSRRALRGPYAEKSTETQSRLAVLVTGSMESLLLTPLLSNVVHANARKGLQVDLFFNLQAANRKGKREPTADPKMANLLNTFDEVSFNGTVMDYVCQLAKGKGATHCSYELETEQTVPVSKNAIQRNILTHHSITTATGKAEVARWRSHSRLWARARAQAGDDEYDAVLVTRADNYWLAPRLVSVEDFQADASQVTTAPCLGDTGINDKAVLMGHEAADVMMGMYEAWQRGDEQLIGTRTAEDAWFRTASQSGLNVVPEPMYAAQASYTQSGLPCFQESTFNVTSKRSTFQECFAENEGDAPVTSLFSAFSCEFANPSFFELIWAQQAKRLQQIVADIANRHESEAVVLTVVDQGEVQAAVSMLTSLQASGEDAKSVVVGTSAGICKALADSSGVAGHKCLVVVPAQDVRLSVFKHAILTTVAVAGLSEKIVYVEPHVTFTSSLGSQLAASGKSIAFAKAPDAAAREAKPKAPVCREAAGELSQIDSSVLYLSDAPEVTDMLLRAWELMSEDSKTTQRAALSAALATSGYSDFGLLSCGQSSQGGGQSDRIVPADSPAGVKEQIKQEVQKAAESNWVDRFRAEASTQRKRADSAAKTGTGELQRRDKWQKQASEWKDAWKARVEELEQENGYNATEIREERRKKREYNRAHKVVKKHVRYLPPEEAAKVKAKEDKWEADKEKQRFEDLEKAEQRREEFKKQVEEAQKIIEGKKKASAPATDVGSQEEETGAA